MNSVLSSSLEPLEDRFSIVLSRLERIEASLAELKDVKKLLVEIEDNTHPDGDNKCDFRNNALEKVSFEMEVRNHQDISYQRFLYKQSLT